MYELFRCNLVPMHGYHFYDCAISFLAVVRIYVAPVQFRTVHLPPKSYLVNVLVSLDCVSWYLVKDHYIIRVVLNSQ